jgi:hypothetical protein
MVTIPVFKVALTNPRADTLTCVRDSSTGYTVETDGFRWPVSVDEAWRLSMAAKRIAWRLDRAERENKQPEAGVFFRRRLPMTDGSTEKIELAISSDEDGADVVFEIDRTSFRMRLAEAAAGLIWSLQRLGGDVETVRRASEPPREPHGIGSGELYQSKCMPWLNR